jgi:hypothetical protein
VSCVKKEHMLRTVPKNASRIHSRERSFEEAAGTCVALWKISRGNRPNCICRFSKYLRCQSVREMSNPGTRNGIPMDDGTARPTGFFGGRSIVLLWTCTEHMHCATGTDDVHANSRCRNEFTFASHARSFRAGGTETRYVFSRTQG